jgi:hypothetical protein
MPQVAGKWYRIRRNRILHGARSDPTAAKGTPGQAPTLAGWISACAEGEGAYIPGGDTTGAAENGYVRPHSSHRRLLVDLLRALQ